jgi:hypothetical protein
LGLTYGKKKKVRQPCAVIKLVSLTRGHRKKKVRFSDGSFTTSQKKLAGLGILQKAERLGLISMDPSSAHAREGDCWSLKLGVFPFIRAE